MCEETSGTGRGLSFPPLPLGVHNPASGGVHKSGSMFMCFFLPPSEVQDHSWSREPSVDMPSQHWIRNNRLIKKQTRGVVEEFRVRGPLGSRDSRKLGIGSWLLGPWIGPRWLHRGSPVPSEYNTNFIVISAFLWCPSENAISLPSPPIVVGKAPKRGLYFGRREGEWLEWKPYLASHGNQRTPEGASRIVRTSSHKMGRPASIFLYPVV